MSANDQGSASLEIVIVLPVLVLMIAGIVLTGRLGTARAAVNAAARDAAREASLHTNPDVARQAATSTAKASLRREGASCPDPGVTVTPTPTQVSVTVSCTPDISDLTPLRRMVGPITGSATELYDPHRSR